MGDLNTESVEKYLENNPQFAKEYFDKKIRAEALLAAYTDSKLEVKDAASFKEMTQVEESNFIFEMIKEIQTSTNLEKPIHQMLQRLAQLVRADKCSMFSCRSRNGTPELTTTLFNVTPTSKLEENLVAPEAEIVFPFDVGVVGWVAHTKKTLNIPDVKKDNDLECDDDLSSISSFGSDISAQKVSHSSNLRSVSGLGGSWMSLYSDAGDFGNLCIQGAVEFALLYRDVKRELVILVEQCQDLAIANVKKQRTDP
ncbi:UNVERIFIED_CONTAM: hypothetical protein FKN15_040214 [Acipenser sinensis]